MMSRKTGPEDLIMLKNPYAVYYWANSSVTNSKYEYRNTKQIQISNVQKAQT